MYEQFVVAQAATFFRGLYSLWVLKEASQNIWPWNSSIFIKINIFWSASRFPISYHTQPALRPALRHFKRNLVFNILNASIRELLIMAKLGTYSWIIPISGNANSTYWRSL